MLNINQCAAHHHILRESLLYKN